MSCECSLTLENWAGETKTNRACKGQNQISDRDWDFMSWYLPIISLHNNSSKVRVLAKQIKTLTIDVHDQSWTRSTIFADRLDTKQFNRFTKNSVINLLRCTVVAEKKKSKLIRELEKKTGLVSRLCLHYNLRIVTRTSIHDTSMYGRNTSK